MSARPPRRRDGTFAVHGADGHEPADGPVVEPVHVASTFAASSTARLDDLYEGRAPGYIYSRAGNPTVDAVAAKLARLERTEAAVLSASGMAAISSTVIGLATSAPDPARRIVAVEDLYGTTYTLLTQLLPRMGWRVDFVPTTDPAALERALREPADLVYLETPTNPVLRLVDLAASAEAARAAGVPSVVDSTFATPVNSRPADLGVDVVVHSATKYLAGHSDLLAGAVCGPRDLLARIRAAHLLLGGVLDPRAASLLDRGLKTLHLRVRQANRNAQLVAEALEADARVTRVHYPGLATHPQHALAREQQPGGFGGVLSLDLPGGRGGAAAFVDALRLVRNAASLGGTESLASIPVVQSHRTVPPDVRRAAGITDGTVRLALGIEDPEDLLQDVRQALDRAVPDRAKDR